MRRRLEACAVAALAALAYANSLHNQPVLDDGWVIFDNPLIKSLANLPRIFREPYNVAGASTLAGVFRPITTLTYALNYALGGPEVLGYHLVSVALHVLCAVLVLLLARRLASESLPAERAEPAALFAALLFAVHPAHVEAVAGLVGRAELLAATGALAAVYLAWTRAEGRWRLPAAVLAVGLGVLCKENAAVAPILFGLSVVVMRPLPPAPSPSGEGENGSASAAPPPRSGRGPGGEVLPALALCAGVAVYPLAVLLGPGRIGVPASSRWFSTETTWEVFCTMTRALAEYWRILAWPHPLGVDFYYSNIIPTAHGFGLAQAGATALWLGLLLAGVLLARRAPLPALGILWVFAALLPVLNIIRIGALMAERFLYLPSAGFCLAAGWALAFLPGRALRAGLGGLALLAALGLGWQRNAQWSDALTLWQAELQNEPRDAVVNNNLAVEYSARGQYQQARERLAVALETAPNYWRAYVNRGIAAHKLGDDAGALSDYQAARAIEPTAPSPDLFEGLLHTDRGEWAQAAPLLGQAAHKAPNDAQAAYWHGRALYETGQLAPARAELLRAQALDPRSPWAPNLITLIDRRLALAPPPP